MFKNVLQGVPIDVCCLIVRQQSIDFISGYDHSQTCIKRSPLGQRQLSL